MSASKLRDEYLLSVLERRLIADALKTKLDLMRSVVGGAPSRVGVSSLSRELESYFELTLPYIGEKTRIKASKDTAKQLNDPMFWRKVLARKKAESQAESSKKVKEVELTTSTSTAL